MEIKQNLKIQFLAALILLPTSTMFAQDVVVRRHTTTTTTTTSTTTVSKPQGRVVKPSKRNRRQTAQPQTAVVPNSLDFTVGDVMFKMIRVEGGTFTTLDYEKHFSEETSEETDEVPTHSVTLPTYYIGETEVTQALWETVMGSNPSEYKGDNLPVTNMSWKDCYVFIDRLNAMTGRAFKMPTMDEWEFAARGGNKSKGYVYSGSNDIDEVAWYGKNAKDNVSESSMYGPQAVKTKGPNELGIYDMSGNASEWCESINDSEDARYFRGGDWGDNSERCYVVPNCYFAFGPTIDFCSVGLRIVLSNNQ